MAQRSTRTGSIWWRSRPIEGRLGEARLLYLKRFWLADPATALGAHAAGLPELPASLAYAAQQLVSALAPCAIYALLATAYSLIYGLVGRINLAFGQIAVIGAFGAVAALTLAIVVGIVHPIAALAVALACAAGLSALWSAVVGRTVVAPLHARHRLGQPILVATAAVAITLEETLRLFARSARPLDAALFNQPIPLAASGPFVVTVTPMQLGAASVALAAAVAVLVLLGRSRFGRHWRAFADDPGAAALFGVAARPIAGRDLPARRALGRPRRMDRCRLLRQCRLRHGDDARPQGAGGSRGRRHRLGAGRVPRRALGRIGRDLMVRILRHRHARGRRLRDPDRGVRAAAGWPARVLGAEPAGRVTGRWRSMGGQAWA